MYKARIREIATNRRWLWLRLVVVALLVIVVIFVQFPGRTEVIDSFESCATAGYPVTQTNPAVCRGPNRSYKGPVQPAISPAPAQAVQSFNLLVNGDSGGAYPQRQELISDQASWERYWREMHAQQPKTPPILHVDFKANDVIALSEGPKPTAGYSLRVTAILVGEAGSTVNVSEQIPAITCQVAQVTSNRYFIVSTAKLPRPVQFRVATDYRRC